MYNFYNPHPQGKNVGDCVKRAITKASGKTYQEVSTELNRLKRAIGASAYNSTAVWTKYVTENLKGIYQAYPAVKGQPRMSGERFCESHPEGTYILRMAGHISCCVNGVIYDSWDCSDKCVYGAYEITSSIVSMIDEDTDIAAAPAPTMTKKTELSGDDIISKMAELIKVDDIKKTRKGELWISLDENNYESVAKELASISKDYRWIENSRSKKTIIRDEKTEMTLVLKSGKNPYLWCTNNGKG